MGIENELDAALMVIANLKAENARYREALEQIANDEWDYNKYGVHHWDRASEALKGTT